MRYYNFLTRAYDDPVYYCQHRLGWNPTHQQEEICEAITPEGAQVSVFSGHGIGKSRILAGLAHWFMETRAYSRIPCTAPTSSTLKDVLWGEMAKVQRISDEYWQSLGWPPQFLLGNCVRTTQDRVVDVSAEREWFMTARTSSRENPDALQGFHAVNLVVLGSGAVDETEVESAILFIVDEASGVPDSVYEVAEGAMSSHGSRLLLCGNPVRRSGYFARSQTEYRSQFTCLQFSSLDSPIADKKYAERQAKRYGTDSNVYRSRVLGKLPRSDDDAMISFEACEDAINREPTIAFEDEPRIMGLDVAWKGSDRTVYSLRHGLNIEYLEIASKQRPTETVAKAIYLRKKLKVDRIMVDEIGIGAGVYDLLAAEGEPVFGVNVANTAPSRDDHEMTNEAEADDLRTWLWLQAKQYLESLPVSFAKVPDRELAADLAAELSLPHVKLVRQGQLRLESKAEMKARLRKELGAEKARSPDIADSVVLTFAPAWEDDQVGTIGTTEDEEYFEEAYVI